MNFDISRTLLSALIAVATAFLLGFVKKRGEVAGDKPLATHWREFLTGRWPRRLHWVGVSFFGATTAAFVWEMATEPGPASKNDVIQAAAISLGWAVVIAARMTAWTLDIFGRAIDALERLINAIVRPPT